jgi:hypothetical protein
MVQSAVLLELELVVVELELVVTELELEDFEPEDDFEVEVEFDVLPPSPPVVPEEEEHAPPNATAKPIVDMTAATVPIRERFMKPPKEETRRNPARVGL